ncbi:hypothetical protein MGU_03054 [Metarhizium guizhouense ARSEF 977]|uniref:Uncharacterized protein n=1 Tax=Metarhizium guizhouense (strain ARSEF 977) TaxID=1276136 RepID=A0A0B4I9I5_METGA|nr:hypothetical protein MGU_03054 [Metarhizium guizhouense ARSEF 977]
MACVWCATAAGGAEGKATTTPAADGHHRAALRGQDMGRAEPRAQSPEQRREHVAAPPEHIVPSRMPARTGRLDGLATASFGRDSISFGTPLGRGRGETGDLGARGGLSLSGGCKWAVWRPHWRRSQERLARPGVGGVEGGPHAQALGHFGHALLLVAVLASFLPSLPSRWTRSLSQGAISHKSSQSPDDSH